MFGYNLKNKLIGAIFLICNSKYFAGNSLYRIILLSLQNKPGIFSCRHFGGEIK